MLTGPLALRWEAASIGAPGGPRDLLKRAFAGMLADMTLDETEAAQRATLRARFSDLDLNARRLVAFHEAGHAVVAALLGVRVVYVRLWWDGKRRVHAGQAHVPFEHPGLEMGARTKPRCTIIERRAVISSAGAPAMLLLSSDTGLAMYGVEQDVAEVKRLAALAGCVNPGAVQTFAGRCLDRAISEVNRGAAAIRSLAERLYVVERVEGEEVTAIVSQHTDA
jgi:hypothetical protein